MNELQRKRIEDKLRRMIQLEDQSKNEDLPVKNIPPGTRVIRRRSGAADKYIA